MHILYVDDDKVPRDAVTSLLEALGHAVDTFSDPRQAIFHYSTTTIIYDLVLTDYQMPLINGTELAFSIRQLNPEQKIICVTGDQERISRLVSKLGINSPIDKVLGKPFNLEVLELTLAEVCGG